MLMIYIYDIYYIILDIYYIRLYIICFINRNGAEIAYRK